MYNKKLLQEIRDYYLNKNKYDKIEILQQK